MENRIKEHENDRYLTTEDGEVYDRLESSFIKNVEKINTYEKMPNDDSDHLLREFTYPAGNAFQTHKGTVIGHNFSLTFQQINQVRSALSRLTTRTDTLQRENEEALMALGYLKGVLGELTPDSPLDKAIKAITKGLSGNRAV